MTMLSPGKIRGLSQVSTPHGIFSILAIDHRDSLRAVLDPSAPDSISAETMTATKLEMLDGLRAGASGVLLDPEYSALQAVAGRAIPGDLGFIVALEAQGYLGDPHARVQTLLEGWGVEKAKRIGAAAVKLLLLYRPDSPAALEQEQLVADVVAECARYDIPLFLEPVSYVSGAADTPGTAQFDADRRETVCESARRLGALGPDVLKVQFPADTSRTSDRAAWADACAELAEASPTPWTLLSGGDSFASFATQVELACEAGASGFLVGRALWGEIVTTPQGPNRRALMDRAASRLSELSDIAHGSGKGWTETFDVPTFGPTSYREV